MRAPSAPPLPWRRRLMYAAVTTVVLLGLIEGGARLLTSQLDSHAMPAGGIGWQAVFFRSLFTWNEPDPDLLWRFRPNLHNPLIRTNSRGLIADEVPYARPAGTLRVMVLGDSSPVGLGLKDRTFAFPEVLTRLLAAALDPDVRVEMINASVTGYTSEQLARLYERELLRYEPDYVVVYCGNNDASVSGSWSDLDLLRSQRAAGLRRLLARSAAYRLLRDLLVRPVRDRGALGAPLVPRVSPERYAANLERIIRACRDDRTRVVLVAPPQRYLWPAGLQFKIFSHVTGEDGEFVFPPQLARLLDRPILYCLDGRRFSVTDTAVDHMTRAVYRSAASDPLDPAAAAAHWQEAAGLAPGDPVAANNLGVALWRNRAWSEADRAFAAARRRWAGQDAASAVERDAAGSPILFNRAINLLDSLADTSMVLALGSVPFVLLDSALQADWMSLRIKQPYLEALWALREKPGVTVVTVAEEFRANGGDGLFVDHCHPTRRGHEIIARALADVILRQERGGGE
ncbi:MAG TPA: SGNH/GDSL hydrolase family protein [candidate division Zixibacteria bacterium]|nr:SGNH/GDSL hydrolase family protein [candidate division Zixibacteria bacterium]MDD4918349.1 SGNH/GDSL hydrolase family protein [candidate division Zixibacteria bacterium]HOD66329.1 SGNH/GDSL hydrolase family protein [candidate division Zixibacteria bacterium]HOZ08126.1 SGNH/GDSL hydrolase family protein [candidate division Zixibacteria bacterium]HPM38316.1 SGNH/GDSL hydrolase family protein [candidate division Zixibacteria bacterium]